MTIQTIGVIGAGQMGSGIAQVVAVAGFDVTLTDINPDALKMAVSQISANLEKQVVRGNH